MSAAADDADAAPSAELLLYLAEFADAEGKPVDPIQATATETPPPATEPPPTPPANAKPPVATDDHEPRPEKPDAPR